MRTLLCFLYLLVARIPSTYQTAKQLSRMSKAHGIPFYKEMELKQAELEKVIAALKAGR